jgi:hypothetical protein
MTQLTERSTSNNKQQIIWFLEFCKVNENADKIFKVKDKKGYGLYRYLLKMFIADDGVLNIGSMDKKQFDIVCKENLEAALLICNKSV